MSRQFWKTLWWSVALSHLDWLACRRRAEPKEGKVLVVRIDGIGDFVLWLRAAAGLRSLYPRSRFHLTLLGNRSWTGLARDQAIFDDVWEADLKRFVSDLRYRFRLMRRVAEAGFSIAINPIHEREFLWGDAIIRASHAPERIGFDGVSSRMVRIARRLSDRWYTRLVSVQRQSASVLELNATFLRELGLGEFRAAIPRLVPTAPLPQELAARDYYVLSAAGGLGHKCWPPDRFARIADSIFEATGWLGAICGGPDDGEVGRQMMAKASAPLRDYTGATTLQQTLSIIAGARMMVGNDTGLIHLATAADTPSICILGGGHYGRFLPYPNLDLQNGARPEIVSFPMECFGCNWQCIYPVPWHAPTPCVTNISVEQVWRTVLCVINRVRENADVRKASVPLGSQRRYR